VWRLRRPRLFAAPSVVVLVVAGLAFGHPRPVLANVPLGLLQEVLPVVPLAQAVDRRLVGGGHEGRFEKQLADGSGSHGVALQLFGATAVILKTGTSTPLDAELLDRVENGNETLVLVSSQAVAQDGGPVRVAKALLHAAFHELSHEQVKVLVEGGLVV